MKKIIYSFLACSALHATLYAQGWHLTGNAGTTPGTDFIGTTDAKALMFKVNKQRSGYIDYDAAKANTSFGFRALRNFAGTNNTVMGYKAAFSTTTGSYNIALGSNALHNNVYGSMNIAIGDSTLYKQVEISENVAIGHQALFSNAGINNNAIGFKALYNNVNGSYNTASGWSSLYNNVDGQYNTANGWKALSGNVSGNHNTATGLNAMSGNIDGTFNTADGSGAMENNISGWDNAACGSAALGSNTSGNNNTAIGATALYSNVTGSNNSALGYSAEVTAGNLSNATAIGYGTYVDASNKVRIGNTTVTRIGGQVGWSTFSDGRYKRNIKYDVHGLDFINSLHPITYTVDINSLNTYYQKGRKQMQNIRDENIVQEDAKAEAEASKIVHNGFIAQEVEEAAKKLGYEFSGIDRPAGNEGLYALRYSDFVVPLVKAVQELSKKNDEKDAQISALSARIAKLETMINTQQSTALTSKDPVAKVPGAAQD